jgi:FkbM family methyltransferase
MFLRRKCDATIQELLLMQSVSKYDITDKIQRNISVKKLERLFFKTIEGCNIESFLEIGALEATASKRARMAKPDIPVLAFEANPYHYKMYSVALKKKGVEYKNIAISNKSGVTVPIKLRLDDKGQHVKNSGNTSLMYSNEHLGKYEIVNVPSLTLDEVFKNNSLHNAALWIDVEGALKIVLGKSKVALKNTQIVFIEVEEREYWTGQMLRPDLDNLMRKHSFIPVARDFQSLYQYNIIYVKSILFKVDLFKRRLLEFYSKN